MIQSSLQGPEPQHVELWGPFWGKPLLCGQGNLEQTVLLAEIDSTQTPRNTVEFFTVTFPEIKEFLQNPWWLSLVLCPFVLGFVVLAFA